MRSHSGSDAMKRESRFLTTTERRTSGKRQRDGFFAWLWGRHQRLTREERRLNRDEMRKRNAARLLKKEGRKVVKNQSYLVFEVSGEDARERTARVSRGPLLLKIEGRKRRRKGSRAS